LQRHFARFGLALADYGPLFEHLDAEHHNKERVKIPLAPANLHWCSDAALEILADYSARYVAPMHMHLVALSRPPIKRNMRAAAAGARHSTTSTASLDKAGINDDRDMLREMRMVLRIQASPVCRASHVSACRRSAPCLRTPISSACASPACRRSDCPRMAATAW